MKAQLVLFSGIDRQHGATFNLQAPAVVVLDGRFFNIAQAKAAVLD
ncbi:MAG TPA: hypothetical protein VLA64_07180 [Azonexus sp.]|nr:hypothetical protein [Azonexus sp.]